MLAAAVAPLGPTRPCTVRGESGTWGQTYTLRLTYTVVFLLPPGCLQVFQTLVHRPEESIGYGSDLGVSQVRHAHFRGLLIEGRACKGNAEHPVHSTFAKAHEWDDPLYNPKEGERVTSIADIAGRARGCAAEGFADKVRRTLLPTPP